MLPISELRGSIPLGILFYELSWFYVFVLSVLGNFLICIPLLYLLGYFETLMKKNRHTDKAIRIIFSNTKSKSKMINLYKYYGVMLFVAIPLPLTGAWTGCLASYLFGFSRKKTLLAIMAGLIISATIMTIMTLSFDQLLIYTGYSKS